MSSRAATLQHSGRFEFVDGRNWSLKFFGNQHVDSKVVATAKRGQLRLSQLNRGAGAFGQLLYATGVVLNTAAYAEGDISGSRYGYRVGTTTGALVVGLAYGPGGLLIGATAIVGELGYDNIAVPAGRGISQAINVLNSDPVRTASWLSDIFDGPGPGAIRLPRMGN